MAFMSRNFASPEEISLKRWEDSASADRVISVDKNGNEIMQQYLLEDSSIINRNSDGSVASIVTMYGSKTRTETINRNLDGSVSSITVEVK